MNDAPLIKFCGLFENVSRSGSKYFVGVSGGIKLLLLENKKRAGDSDPGWHLFITERGERPEKKQADRETVKQRAAEAQRPLIPATEPPAGDRPSGDGVPFDDPLPPSMTG